MFVIGKVVNPLKSLSCRPPLYRHRGIGSLCWSDLFRAMQEHNSEHCAGQEDCRFDLLHIQLS